MAKELKTNAMRILDKLKIPYEFRTYECENFTDGTQIADLLGEPREKVFKTLVTIGKSGKYYVFCISVEHELDLKKCAAAAEEKSVSPIHVKDIQSVTGYIRGGCSPVGMKKQYSTFIHKSAEALDKIVVSGGKLGMQLILTPEDLIKACSGKYADIILTEA